MITVNPVVFTAEQKAVFNTPELRLLAHYLYDFVRLMGQKESDHPGVHLSGIKNCFSSIIEQVGAEHLIEAKIPQSESQLYDARLKVLLEDGTKLLINNYANESIEPIGKGKCYSTITIKPAEGKGISCYVHWEE